eukprot:Selendium_serpulae@DN6076_c0_g1_i6.p2
MRTDKQRLSSNCSIVLPEERVMSMSSVRDARNRGDSGISEPGDATEMGAEFDELRTTRFIVVKPKKRRDEKCSDCSCTPQPAVRRTIFQSRESNRHETTALRRASHQEANDVLKSTSASQIK